jgi:hypothetical protein
VLSVDGIRTLADAWVVSSPRDDYDSGSLKKGKTFTMIDI